MSQSESPAPAFSDPVISDLTNQVSALQRQVFSLLLVLIVVSGTVSVYLYRQASLMRKDIDAYGPQARQIEENYNRNSAAMKNFVDQLTVYSQKNADIHQLLVKYEFAAAPAPKK
jgi:hypothetical protein